MQLTEDIKNEGENNKFQKTGYRWSATASLIAVCLAGEQALLFESTFLHVLSHKWVRASKGVLKRHSPRKPLIFVFPAYIHKRSFLAGQEWL